MTYDFTKGTIDLIQEYRSGSKFTDVNLSGAGISAKRKQLTDAAVAKARGPIDTYKTVADNTASKVRADALAAIRPLTPDAAVLQDLARQKVEVLLKSGRDLARIIEITTDVTTLAAIVQWGPTWVQAATPYPTNPAEQATFVEPDTDWIEGAVLDRLAEVVAWDPFAKVGAASKEVETVEMWADLATSLVADGMTGQTAEGTWNQLYLSDPAAYTKIRAALA